MSETKTPRTDALRKSVSWGESAFDEVLEAHALLETELAAEQQARVAAEREREEARKYRLPWTPGETARRFHTAYENFAPMFGYRTRPESAVPWDQVPENNRALMIAVVRNVLIEQASDAAIDAAQRKEGQSK